jgi:hypothetical protein
VLQIGKCQALEWPEHPVLVNSLECHCHIYSLADYPRGGAVWEPARDMIYRMKGFCRATNSILLAGSCLLLLPLLCVGQTVVASARVVCGVGQSWESSGPIVGALINQTNTVT